MHPPPGRGAAPGSRGLAPPYFPGPCSWRRRDPARLGCLSAARGSVPVHRSRRTGHTGRVPVSPAQGRRTMGIHSSIPRGRSSCGASLLCQASLAVGRLLETSLSGEHPAGDSSSGRTIGRAIPSDHPSSGPAPLDGATLAGDGLSGACPFSPIFLAVDPSLGACPVLPEFLSVLLLPGPRRLRPWRHSLCAAASAPSSGVGRNTEVVDRKLALSPSLPQHRPHLR